MADLSQLNVNNNDYNLKDAAARNDIQSTQVVSGNPLTLTDCAPINAESLKVELEPKQDLHGQSAPYVGGAGKNKLPLDLAKIKSSNTVGNWSGNAYYIYGVTFTVNTDDGGNVTGINIDGTLTSDYVDFLLDGDTRKPLNEWGLSIGTTYILSGNRDGAHVIYNGVVANITSGTFTADTSDSYFPCIRIIRITYSNVLIQPMVRLSTETDPTFAPYSNICPITGYTQTSVEGCGKNFANPVLSGYYDSSGFVSNDQWTACELIECTPNTQYTLSNDANIGGNIFYYDANNDFISYVSTGNTPNTFTTPSNAKYMGIYGRGFSHCQLEKGDTQTTFETYASTSATIQFGQTVYGGSVDFKTGVVTVDKGFEVFDGSNDEGWVGRNENKSRTTSKLQGIIKNASSDGVAVNFLKSNMFKKGSADEGWGGDPNIIGVGTDGLVYTSTGETMSISDWTTYLVNNNLQICYELATPFTIQLTPEELKLLKGTNNLSADGVMQIGYQPDNVIGEVKGEIEKHLEMPWVKVIDDDATIDFDDIPIEGPVEYAYVLADNEFFKHRFILLEVYEMEGGLIRSFVRASALLSIDTLLEFSGNGYGEMISFPKSGDTVEVFVGIVDDDGTYKFTISLESTGQTIYNDFRARARYVD